MANLSTVTGNTTYSMLINQQSSTGFQLTATEASSNVISINTNNPLLNTNYKVNSSGSVIEASFDIVLDLSVADIAALVATVPGASYVRAGWVLYQTNVTPNVTFNYSFGSSTGNTFLTSAPTATNTNWLLPSPIVAMTNPQTISVKVQYLGNTSTSTFTPGDNITFNVGLYVQQVDNTGAPIGETVTLAGNLPGLTVTVQMCLLNAAVSTVQTSGSTFVSPSSYFVGNQIIFKTAVSATLTNANYLQSTAVQFSQTINSAIALTTGAIYLTASDTNTSSGNKPSGAITVTNATTTGNVVSFTVNSTLYPELQGVTTGTIANFWVWVYGTINSMPA